MPFGSKGGSTNVTTPEMTPEQREYQKASNEFFTGTIAPTYQNAVRGATDLYNQATPGVTNAAQNLAGTAAQVGQTTGEVGESALRTGVSGLQSLFSPDYAQEQLNAAMAPAQAQYQQNLAQQQAQFGGAGNLGSSRQALAGQQLAGQTQSAQAATAANILRDISAQRAQVGGQLAQIGSGGLGQSVDAAKTGVNAAGVNMDKFAQLASIYYGVPQASYGMGPTGTSSTGTTSNIGFKF
jgi:hypothetical protein